MFGSDVLDIGIGASLIFLFISLIATSLHEAIEGILNTRARALEVGIRNLLADPTGAEITKDIYDHPMISSLFLGSYDASKVTADKQMTWRNGRHLPSYIPSAQFVEALLDRTAKGAVAAAPDVNAVWSQLSADSLRASIATLPNAQLQRALGVALDQAEGDIDKVKANLEAWFNGAMDRIAGWYKSRSQLILFLLGLGAAVTFNIDTIEVIQRLAHDKDLRAAAVGYAGKITPADRAPGAVTLPADLQQRTFLELKSQIDTIGYPIGWSPQIPQWQDQACPAATAQSDPAACPAPAPWLWTVIKMGLGWFITALAVLLGAPFWFDVLNRFMIVRSTVKPREKSRDEGGKDGGAGASDASDDDAGGGGDGPTGGAAAVQALAPPLALAGAPAGLAPVAFVPHEWANAADKQEGLL